MTQTSHLVELAQTLAAHEGVGHFAISMRIFGKGDFFHRLLTNRKADCQTRTAVRALSWFDTNWPGCLMPARLFPVFQRSTPMRKLWAALRRLDDHPIGDAIGVICLFGILYLCLFAELVFGAGQ
jgi:hypothetical protein